MTFSLISLQKQGTCRGNEAGLDLERAPLPRPRQFLLIRLPVTKNSQSQAVALIKNAAHQLFIDARFRAAHKMETTTTTTSCV